MAAQPKRSASLFLRPCSLLPTRWSSNTYSIAAPAHDRSWHYLATPPCPRSRRSWRVSGPSFFNSILPAAALGARIVTAWLEARRGFDRPLRELHAGPVTAWRLAFRRIPAWRDSWLPSLLTVPAIVLANVAFSALGNGAATRAGTVVVFLWIGVISVPLMQKGDRSEPEHRRGRATQAATSY